MKRWVPWVAAVVCATFLAPALRADVKTREKSTAHFEGMMGMFLNRASGGSDGITSAVAVKGNRMARMSDSTGQIIDLSEQKVYTLEPKKKEYSVMTFAQMRAQMEQARADMAKQSQQASPEDKPQAQDAGKQVEFDVDVKETGQHKPLLSYDTHEVVMTITTRQKGKTLEEGGGMVMTNDMWLAPKIAALDEVRDFELKYFQAVFGDTFAGVDPAQMNALATMLPNFSVLGEKMAAEAKKLQGSPLSSSMTIETVKSPEDMQNAQDNQAKPASGLGSMLANRLMKKNSTAGARSKLVTIGHDVLSLDTTVSADDLAVPAGFKLKSN